jgi:hypothetical protein
MKNYPIITASLFSLFFIPITSHAFELEGSKGPRLSPTANEGQHHYRHSTAQTPYLNSTEDFDALKTGDRISHYCPMTEKTTITTVRALDSKGHAKIIAHKSWMNHSECKLSMVRDNDNTVHTTMTCPDGVVRAVKCKKV